MSEYIKREAALKKIKELQETNPSTVGKKQFSEGYFLGLDEAEIVLLQTPTVDVVEVVRCKECCFYEEVEYYPNGTKSICRLLKRQLHPDDYCSYGERKIDNA